MNAIKAFEDNVNAQLEDLYTQRRIALGNLVELDRDIARIETLADLNELHRSNNKPNQENGDADATEK